MAMVLPSADQLGLEGANNAPAIRFFAPDYEKMEVFAHIGGQPLGMAFDRDDNLYVCIGGMGLYRIKPDGTVEKATDLPSGE